MSLNTPNPVDVHVGERIRARRRVLGISQENLAEDLGLTYQQIQKYEKGANRVSASKLWAISRSLKAPIEYFFEGLAGDQDTDVETVGVFDQLFGCVGGAQIARIYPALPPPAPTRPARLRRGPAGRGPAGRGRGVTEEQNTLEGPAAAPLEPQGALD